MRGLRASRASAALALVVLAACLAPCGVGASGFDAAAQGRARARDTHRHRRTPSAPRPTSLSPTSAHVSGGAVLTIKGVGFEDTPGLAVRFAASSGAPDGGPLLHETRARFISRTVIECFAPRVASGDPVVAHVSVSNGDGVWSAPPLVHVRDAGTTRGVALTLEYDDANPGCPGCGVGGFQSALAPAARVRERWVAVPDVAPTTGGSEITVRAVGYAVNDPSDPFDATLVRDARDVDATSLPPGWVALLGGAPSGGPGSRGRGGASRGGVSPTAATHGPRPRGTFLPGDGLRCRFECPIELAFPPDATSEARAAAGAALFAAALAPGAAAADAASAACVAPPFPALPAAIAASIPANAVATISRRCRVALSNDRGNAFDDGDFGNAARAAFRYSDAPPVLLGAADDVGDADAGDRDAFPKSPSFFPTERVAPGLFLLRRAATTTHVNAALSALGIAARGPLAGGVEVTLAGSDARVGGRLGSNFVPNAPDAACRFVFGSDAPVGPRTLTTRATIASDGKTARCVSPPRRLRRAGGAAGPTAPPSSAAYPPVLTHAFGSPGCFFASVALSNDGATFSNATAAFLYCDTHVAPLGDGVDPESAYGTPSRPFPDVQSALAAALRGARRDDDAVFDARHAETSGASVASRRWLNRDVLRLAPGVYGGDGNVELAVASDQMVEARVAGDDDDDDADDASFFLLTRRRGLAASSALSPPVATVSCGGDRPLFASTRTARARNVGGSVSFSPSVFFDGCHFDGREAVTGTRCASRHSPHGGCAGGDAYVLPERPDAVGGLARDPSSWEAFDYDDALEYGGFPAEAFYDFA